MIDEIGRQRARKEAAQMDWPGLAKGIIKAQLKLRHMTYADLAEALADVGVQENERNLMNKLSRGSFTAAFFLQCMAAIGVDSLDLGILTLVPEVKAGRVTKDMKGLEFVDEQDRQEFNKSVDYAKDVIEGSKSDDD